MFPRIHNAEVELSERQR